MSTVSAGATILDALTEAGVTHIFANWGSDHSAIVEALAEARATGRPVPAVVACPNEMVALSAAHGHAQVSGRAQAVIVHVECGTQAMAGTGALALQVRDRAALDETLDRAMHAVRVERRCTVVDAWLPHL